MNHKNNVGTLACNMQLFNCSLSTYCYRFIIYSP